MSQGLRWMIVRDNDGKGCKIKMLAPSSNIKGCGHWQYYRANN